MTSSNIDRETLRDAVEEIIELREALLKAVELIQSWHNMGMSGKMASDTWDIYWRNAPELKLIREALLNAKGRS